MLNANIYLKFGIGKPKKIKKDKGKKVGFNFKKLLDNLRFSNINLRWKFVGMALMISFIPIIVVSFINIQSSKSIIEQNIHGSNNLYSRLASERIESYFHDRKVDAQMLVTSQDVKEGISVLNTFSASEIEEQAIYNRFEALLSVPVEEYEFTDIFITNKYGEVIFSLNYDPLDIAPLVFSNDFVEIAMSGEQNWSSLFRNSFIDDNIMVLSTPISQDDLGESSSIGTLNMVLNQKALTGLVRYGVEEIGSNGDSFLIDSSGKLMTDTLNQPYDTDSALNITLETEAVAYVQEAVDNKQMDFNLTKSYKTYTGEDVIGTMTTTLIGDTPVALITEIGVDQAYSVVGDLSRTIMLISAIVILIASSLAMVISLTISKPIERIIRLTNKLSNYQLNIKNEHFKHKDRRDEIGDLQRSVHSIAENLVDLLTQVDQSADNVVNSSKALHEGAMVSLEIASSIEQGMGEISMGSSDQVKSTEIALDNTTALNQVLHENKSELDGVVEFTGQVSDLVESGLDIVNELVKINDETQKTNRELHKSILKSLESFKHIEESTYEIVDVAKKTKLLSLNASIEAARAGIHGSGFSVVSDEIGHLAIQSQASSSKINKTIDQLKVDNGQVEQRINELINISNLQINSIDETRVKYHDINSAMNETKSLVNKLCDYQENIDQVRLALEDKIVSLSSVSEQNAVSSGHVSSKINSQTEISDSIVQSSKKLDDLSNKLKQEVNKFVF